MKNLSYFDFIVKDCILSLNVSCPNSLVVFTSKESNIVAHELAKAAISMYSSYCF